MNYIYKSSALGLPAKNLFIFLVYNCLLFKPKKFSVKFTSFQRISVHKDRKKHRHLFLTLLLKRKKKAVIQPSFFTSTSSSTAYESQ